MGIGKLQRAIGCEEWRYLAQSRPLSGLGALICKNRQSASTIPRALPAGGSTMGGMAGGQREGSG